MKLIKLKLIKKKSKFEIVDCILKIKTLEFRDVGWKIIKDN